MTTSIALAGACGRQEEALAAHQRAGELQPANATSGRVQQRSASPWPNWSGSMKRRREFERALQIDPASAIALNGLGNAFPGFGPG